MPYYIPTLPANSAAPAIQDNSSDGVGYMFAEDVSSVAQDEVREVLQRWGCWSDEERTRAKSTSFDKAPEGDVIYFSGVVPVVPQSKTSHLWSSGNEPLPPAPLTLGDRLSSLVGVLGFKNGTGGSNHAASSSNSTNFPPGLESTAATVGSASVDGSRDMEPADGGGICTTLAAPFQQLHSFSKSRASNVYTPHSDSSNGGGDGLINTETRRHVVAARAPRREQSFSDDDHDVRAVSAAIEDNHGSNDPCGVQQLGLEANNKTSRRRRSSAGKARNPGRRRRKKSSSSADSQAEGSLGQDNLSLGAAEHDVVGHDLTVGSGNDQAEATLSPRARQWKLRPPTVEERAQRVSYANVDGKGGGGKATPPMDEKAPAPMSKETPSPLPTVKPKGRIMKTFW